MTTAVSWIELIDETAREAIALCERDGGVASVHRPRQGERWVSLGLGAGVAAALAQQRGLAEATAAVCDAAVGDGTQWAGRVRVVDALGHSRPVYGALLALLLKRAAGGLNEAGALKVKVDAAAEMLTQSLDPGDISHRLWAAAVRGQTCVEGCEGDGPLHALGHDDVLDAWTYRELTGLHALDLLSHRPGGVEWRERVRQIAVYHQAHTQPDYTTYQPWALAAFSRDAVTRPFAEQQLHDVRTHLAVEGGVGAAVIAMLLVDASLCLRGDAACG